MSCQIYHLDEKGNATAMEEQPYDAEETLQKLLAEHPEVLAGEQGGSGRRPTWLLIQREMPVPAEEGASGQLSLDHLFLDQDGVLTLVEVKRSTNRELRRQVVAQMLDYAANAVAYWPVGDIRTRFEARYQDADQVLAEITDAEAAEEFWEAVDRNLRAGKIRMVFVSDVIPPELRRIVEFLNEQMRAAEVLAIEVKQYVGGGKKTLVPRVIGQSRDVPTPPVTKRQWDETSFFADLLERRGQDEAQAARRLLNWANVNGLRIWWGQGQFDGSFYPIYDNRNGKSFLFSVLTTGKVEIQFQHMNYPPFDDEMKRKPLADRISAISHEAIADSSLSKRPSFKLESLVEIESCNRFLEVFDWVLDEIKRCASNDTLATLGNSQ